MHPPLPRGDSRLSALLAANHVPYSAARYTLDEVLFSQGDPGETVMYLSAGRVRLNVLSRNGGRAVAGLLEAGAFLGDEALAGRPRRLHTATAMCETDVVTAAKADMLRALHSDPAVADLFLSHVLARGHHLQTDLADQLLHSGPQRLARLLLRLAGGEDDDAAGVRRALPHLSQELMAEMVGATRSRVNLMLSSFRRRALIEARDGMLYVTPRLHRWVASFNDCAIGDGAAAATSVRLGTSGLAEAQPASR